MTCADRYKFSLSQVEDKWIRSAKDHSYRLALQYETGEEKTRYNLNNPQSL